MGEMKLGAIIANACEVVGSNGEFTPESVYEYIEETSPGEIEEHARRLSRRAIIILIKSHLKKTSPDNFGEEVQQQMQFAGFDRVPQNLSFSSGGTVLYINTMKATEDHFRSAVALREASIRHDMAWVVDINKMLDFLLHSGCETFGEALAKGGDAKAA